MTQKDIEKLIETWEFVQCPTEESDPFFWRWTDDGKEQLAFYIWELINARSEDTT